MTQLIISIMFALILTINFGCSAGSSSSGDDSGGTSDPFGGLTGDATRGATEYTTQGCNGCHGSDGSGGTAQNIQSTAAATFESAVRNGVSGTSMNSYPVSDSFSDQDLADIFAYVTQ